MVLKAPIAHAGAEPQDVDGTFFLGPLVPRSELWGVSCRGLKAWKRVLGLVTVFLSRDHKANYRSLLRPPLLRRKDVDPGCCREPSLAELQRTLCRFRV